MEKVPTGGKSMEIPRTTSREGWTIFSGSSPPKLFSQCAMVINQKYEPEFAAIELYVTTFV